MARFFTAAAYHRIAGLLCVILTSLLTATVYAALVAKRSAVHESQELGSASFFIPGKRLPRSATMPGAAAVRVGNAPQMQALRFYWKHKMDKALEVRSKSAAAPTANDLQDHATGVSLKDSASVGAELGWSRMDDEMQWSELNGQILEELRVWKNKKNISDTIHSSDNSDWYTSPYFETLSSRESGDSLLSRLEEKKTEEVGPQRPEDVGKLTVVLDLDECLLHTLRPHEEQSASSALEKIDTGLTMSNLRPGLRSFLEAASQEFELMIYTSGQEDYARRLLDQLDPKGTIFRHRLYRGSCIWCGLSVGSFTKDLARFNRPMGRIVLVDDDPMNFVAQLQNGVPIKAFRDDETDTALCALGSLLQLIKNEPDVRPFLTRSFNLENLLRDEREKMIG